MIRNIPYRFFRRTAPRFSSGKISGNMIRLSLLLTLPTFTCNHRTHPNEPVVPAMSAVIFEQGGESVADGAIVKFFDAGSIDGRPDAVFITDGGGRFSIENLSTGIYSMRAEKDGAFLLQDSVIVAAAQTTLRDDTLECASSLSGYVSVKPEHDPRTVTIRLIGTDQVFDVADLHGAFTLPRLAAGAYSLLLTSSIPDYVSTVTAINVAACSHDTLDDTLRLAASGIPLVEGIRIVQDTATGEVKLSWKKTRHRDFLDYLIYREYCGARDFLHEPLYVTDDTFYIDSIYVALPADTADTAGRCLRYWIAVRTNETKIGLAYRYAEMRFAPKAYVMAAPHHRVWNDAQPECDSASIDDTVVISLNARSRTRPLHSITWFDPEKKDTVSTMLNPDTLAMEIADTIRYAFPAVGTHPLRAIILDQAGSTWIDTISVHIVPDIPVANAGYDTGVFVGEKAYLHGRALQQFGKITEWKWKIDKGDWNATSGPDTVIVAPSIERSMRCSLQVIDEDGNEDVDAMNVITSLKVTAVAAGAYHSLLIKSDGSLWACGYNGSGQLGVSGTTGTDTFVAVMRDVKGIAAGSNHSLLVKTDGSLLTCGYNGNGQLGNGTTNSGSIPVKVMDNVQSIAAGADHSLILTGDNILLTCGANDSGQLGDGTNTGRFTPVKVMSEVKSIAAGGWHSLMLKTDGTLWACGKGHSGQLGNLASADTNVPVQVAKDVQAMAAGDRHSLVLKNDNSVWSSGNNWYGQLGDSSGGRRLKPQQVMTDVKSVAAGTGFSHFIKLDGTLWVSGLNNTGQIGGEEKDTLPWPVMLTGEVQAVAAGERHSMILKTDGTLWVCGDNEVGQLGDGTMKTRFTLTRVVPFMADEEEEVNPK